MEPENALREVFGLAEFRPGQRDVVDAVLSGRPTVAVMPTGAGKSLCYQLPAVVAGGTALVVSPLIALMKDQVDSLNERGIQACAVNSSLPAGELAARLEDIAQGRVRLAYVAPERFRSPRFEEALARLGPRLSLLAIDEAHCISEWGHDFRPDYMRLGEVVERLRPPRIVALTATATPEVRRDIQRQLGLHEPAVFVRGFDRPNLHFAVEQVGGAAAKMARLRELVAARGGPVLVYAATRKNAEAYTDELVAAGRRARVYHAGLGEAERGETQDAFMTGAVDVVVATNAFGMGVDKSDVRLVVHADLPRSPEAYYQEAGRGGRDGEPAECILLFNHGDVKLQEFLIDAGAPSLDLLRALWRAVRSDPRLGADTSALRRALPSWPSDAALASGTRFLVRAGYLRDREGVYEAVHPSDLPDGVPPARLDAAALAARADVERQKLRALVDYVYTSGCRRRFILAYFGDEDASFTSGCSGCDNCLAERRDLDGDERRQVNAILALAVRLGGRFGRTRMAGILTGEDDDDRWSELPDHGAMRREGKRRVLDLIRALEGSRLLVSSGDEYPTLVATTLGRRVLAGQPIAMALPRPPAGRERKRTVALKAAADDLPPADNELADRLRAFRREIAARESLPAYCIFGDKTLEAIARARPRDLGALGILPGIGPVKLARYGPAILEITKESAALSPL
jgi:ATP-dependent DNA helicase RecQ